MADTTVIIGIVGAAFGSTGLWQLINFAIQRKATKDSAQSKMLKGLAHDRICTLGEIYIKRGSITKDEYENLRDYLYAPYEALGGNGTAKKIVEDCGDLPIKETKK